MGVEDVPAAARTVQAGDGGDAVTSTSLSARIVPPKQEEPAIEITPTPERTELLALAEELSLPELSLDGRLAIAQRLRELFGAENALSPPERNMELVRCKRIAGL